MNRSGSTSCWRRASRPEADAPPFDCSAAPAQSASNWRITDGVIGFSLLARPLAKQYATLSVWRDEDALAAFAGTEPHRGLMTKLSPEMGPTKFVRWTMRGSAGRPSWDDALQRLS